MMWFFLFWEFLALNSEYLKKSKKSYLNLYSFVKTDFTENMSGRKIFNFLHLTPLCWSTKRHPISTYLTFLRHFINYCALLSYSLGNLTRTLINQVWKINSILADASRCWCFVYFAAASIFWNAIRHSKCQVGACHLIHQVLLKNE